MALTPPSPAPWVFAETLYGLRHCLVDRDGRVITTNLPIGNGPLLEQAPAMVEVLRELAAGASVDELRIQVLRILSRVDEWHAREPGEDDA
jgi:hypothetical protein